MTNKDSFGNVTWCEQDIINAVENICGDELEEFNEIVNDVCSRCGNGHELTDVMISAGWDVINSMVYQELERRNIKCV